MVDINREVLFIDKYNTNLNCAHIHKGKRGRVYDYF